MNPELIRLKLVTIIALAGGVFFLAYVAQRAWYRARTKKLSHVETIHFRGVQEGSCLLAGLVLTAFGVCGWFTVRRLAGYQPMPAADSSAAAIKEFEVAAAGSGGFTLLMFPAGDEDAASAARREGMIVSGAQGFVVKYEVVRFGPVLRLLGQPDLVRVLSVEGDFGAAEGAVPITPPERAVVGGGAEIQQDAGRLVLAVARQKYWLDWPVLSEVKERVAAIGSGAAREAGAAAGTSPSADNTGSAIPPAPALEARQRFLLEADGSGGLRLRALAR